MIVGEIVAKMKLDARGFAAGIDRVKRKTTSLSAGFVTGAKKLLVFKNAYIAVAAASVYAGKQLTNTLLEIDQIKRKMDTVTGGAEQAANAWAFLRTESKRLGMDMKTLANNYASFTAASVGSKLSGEELQKIFVAVTQKARSLSLSNYDVERSFRGLTDMMNKGVVNAQDFKLQLSQAMPGALDAMAKAVGVTTNELQDLIATGKLATDDVLPRFAEELKKSSDRAIDSLNTSLRMSVSGLSTAWFDLKSNVSDGVVNTALIAVIDSIQLAVVKINWLITGLNKLVDTIKKVPGYLVALGKGFAALGSDLNQGLMGADYATIVREVTETATQLTESAAETAIKTTEAASGATVAILARNREALEEWRTTVMSTAESTLGEFTSFVSGMATGADVTFGDMLNNMSKHLLDFTTNMLVIKPILEWFEGWLGGVTGGGGGGVGFMSSIMGLLGANMPVKAMAGGGIISEPVFGIGAESHTGYLMGEAGPEEISPLGKGGGSGGGGNTVNVNISALDSKSLTEMMQRNPQAITGPLVNALKNGDRGLAASLRRTVN